MNVNLSDYLELKRRADLLNEQVKLMESEINAAMAANGIDSAKMNLPDGTVVRAYFKPGVKSTNHEAAAMSFSGDKAVLSDIVSKYTTVKTTTTIAWAKVTKELKVGKKPFTTEGSPTFVIEVAHED